MLNLAACASVATRAAPTRSCIPPETLPARCRLLRRTALSPTKKNNQINKRTSGWIEDSHQIHASVCIFPVARCAESLCALRVHNGVFLLKTLKRQSIRANERERRERARERVEDQGSKVLIQTGRKTTTVMGRPSSPRLSGVSWVQGMRDVRIV